MIPAEFRIDYPSLCGSGRAHDQALVTWLREQLPIKWRDVYAATSSHVANIVQIRRGTFDYFCDSYSTLEALGEVPFDQRVQDRVIGVLGTSAPTRNPRRGSLQNAWLAVPEEIEGSARDRGHFIAHSIGGGLDINVFSQARALNRGASEQGKRYREAENTAASTQVRSASCDRCTRT